MFIANLGVLETDLILDPIADLLLDKERSLFLPASLATGNKQKQYHNKRVTFNIIFAYLHCHPCQTPPSPLQPPSRCPF